MIPPLLHYVWIPEREDDHPGVFALACRNRARELHPGWGIREWREDGLIYSPDLGELGDEVVRAWGKFAGRPTARSDLFRLCALYVHGGIYLDYDVWTVRPFDEFLPTDLLLGCNSFDPFTVGEHVIGSEPRSPKVAAVIRYFCGGPKSPNGKYSPHLARFVYEFGWEAQLPDVFCPHPRDAPAADLYRVTPVTHAIHCWSPLGYEVARLREATDNAPPVPAPESLKHLEICVP